MRYVKGGMDEAELARYNTTPFSGLDNTLPNSYANSLLQVEYSVNYKMYLLLNPYYFTRCFITFPSSENCCLGTVVIENSA